MIQNLLVSILGEDLAVVFCILFAIYVLAVMFVKIGVMIDKHDNRKY